MCEHAKFRQFRDGLYLVLLALAWNIGASVAALSWLGYIGVNHAQMTAATEHLFGHYGLVIVFMLKHIQVRQYDFVVSFQINLIEYCIRPR